MIPKDELKGKIKSVIEISYKAINSDSGEVSKGEREWKRAIHKDSQRKYDVNKNIVEKNRYNADGSLDYKWTYKYDDAGNMVEENDYPDGSLFTKYSYKYDDAGNVAEEEDYDADGKLFDRYSYKYEGNRMVEEINYATDGSVYSKSTYKYDKSGNMIEKNEYNSKGKLNSTSTFSFDSRDNIIKKGGTSAYANRWAYIYDDDGNIVEMDKYDFDNKLREKCKYSHNTVEKIVIDYETDNHGLPDDNSPMKAKEIIIKDDNGNVIERNEYTFQGGFISYLSRSNTYKYKFDDRGNWIERIQSENGVPQYITERNYEYYE